MDGWNRYFATTGLELDMRDALVALERIVSHKGLDPSLRISLEAAAAALREAEAESAGASGPGCVRSV
jgi:hypothetical protein